MRGGASEAFKRDHPWYAVKAGSDWTIRARTDPAGLLMQEVRTPVSFSTKREAQEWIEGSLMSHVGGEAADA